ncbi:MAG: transforming growth factor-beta-induced protein [Chlamydiales bacterium]|jgi:transforming growth factor-beta-induced protein
MLLTTTLLSTALFAGFAGDDCSSSKSVKTVSATPVGKNIVETALAADSFSTLVTALKAADLTGALAGEGPFTVFAPTNEAFARLPEDKLSYLLDPANKALLQSILTYHVAPGKLEAADVLKASNSTTLNGQRVEFEVTDGGININGANIIKTDIECSNGVIHVIDAIILPSTMDIIDTAVGAGSFKTLAAALEAAQLIGALRGDGPFTVFAPTDEAFAALPEGTVANLLKPENRDQLAAILTFHVVPGRVYADAVAAGHELKTLQGQVVKTRSASDGSAQVLVNGARVLKADIETSNGVIHVIDTVLLPE